MGDREDEITRIPTGAGRGGFGNFVEAKKNENKPGSPPPPRRPSADSAYRVYSTGRGGLGNMKVGPTGTTEDRQQQPLTTKTADAVLGLGSGRGGFGNKIFKQKEEEKAEKAKRDALAAEQARAEERARAEAKAAVEALQKPAQSKSS